MNPHEHPAMLLVGAPYLRGGNAPRDGFDCFTLTRYVRKHHFERDTPAGAIPADTMSSTLAGAFAIYRALGGKERIGSPWLECEAGPGCVAAMGQWKVSRLHHCGVIVGPGVLHAMTHCGVVWTPLLRIRDIYARVEFFECHA
jgi:cell wall-associated NlpC family hydrolase